MRWTVLRFALWLLLALGPGAAAHAAAWPREAGHAFIDLSDDGYRRKLYAEYGLKGDLTMGVEVQMPRGRRLPDVLQFVRHPIHRFANGAILSGGLSWEVRETLAAGRDPSLKGTPETAVRAGLYLGRGFGKGWRSGWMELDAEVERVVTTDWLGQPWSGKLDATLGWKPTDRVLLYLQAQTYRRDPDPISLRLEPAAAVKLGRAHLVVSPSVGVLGARDPRLKLGLWLDF